MCSQFSFWAYLLLLLNATQSRNRSRAVPRTVSGTVWTDVNSSRNHVHRTCPKNHCITKGFERRLESIFLSLSTYSSKYPAWFPTNQLKTVGILLLRHQATPCAGSPSHKESENFTKSNIKSCEYATSTVCLREVSALEEDEVND